LLPYYYFQAESVFTLDYPVFKPLHLNNLKTIRLMKTLRLFIFLLLAPVFCFSWNGNGHMTAGAVAYYYLKKNNPAVLKQVLASLKLHPWYNTVWITKINALPAAERDVALFMLASTFPDDARKDSVYGGPEHAKWHYINYPFIPQGQIITPPVIPAPNAEGQLTYFLSSLEGTPNSQQKAVDLCWLFHITEDIHQPLHTVALFDGAHPSGDKGGNDTYIHLPKPSRDTCLHTYWDALVPGTFTTIPAKAKKLLNEPKYRESKFPELRTDTTINSWIETEGVALAKTTVYKNGTISGTKTNPTLVTVAYMKDASAVGERRVVLAGIRLAKELIRLYQ
jgi:hypothetical protein